MFFGIKNHVSTEAFEVKAPWDFDHKGYPTANKDKYRALCKQESYEHLFISGWEGKLPDSRISKEVAPSVMYAIITDYDHKIPLEELASVSERCNPHAIPNFAVRTHSGGARLVWLLEAPIFYDSREIFERKMEEIEKKLDLPFLLKGWDKDAFYSPNKYYEVGRDWYEIHDKPMAKEWAAYMNFKHAKSDNFRNEAGTIPFDVIEKEMERRGWLTRWGIKVADGERSCRFWDDASWQTGSAGSVVMLTGGCYNHSNRGKPGFNSWEDIFGPSFCDQFKEKKLGAVVNDWYYTGREYWNRDESSLWKAVPSEVAKRTLKVRYGLDPRLKKNEDYSELEQMMSQVETVRRIDGVLPFPLDRRELVTIGDQKFLNDSSIKMIQPAPEGKSSYKDAEFFLSLLENWFSAEIKWEPGKKPFVKNLQLAHLVSWMKVLYAPALAGTPRAGQGIFIAGEPGCGKSLFSVIIGRLMGGSCSAKSFFMDGNRFTSDLARFLVWRLDDDTSHGDGYDTRAQWTKRIKQYIANPRLDYEKKHGDRKEIDHLGRVISTLNMDAESMRMVPDLDVSIRDKVCLYLLKVASPFHFPDNNTIENKILPKELPHIGRFLMDFEIPKQFLGESRYTIKSYINPVMEKASVHESDTYSFVEILDQYFGEYAEDSDEEFWIGTASKLLVELSEEHSGVSTLVRRFNSTRVARNLNGLIRQGFKGLEMLDEGDVRLYRISLKRYAQD